MTRDQITAAITTDADALNHLITLLATTTDPATINTLLSHALDAARTAAADDIEAALRDADHDDAADHVADHYGTHAVA